MSAHEPYNPPFVHEPVPEVDEFFSLNDPPIGSLYPSDVYKKNENPPALFKPLTIRGMSFKNRIFVAPMCMYSSDNGHATDWHLVHIGALAARGAEAICQEATGVVPEGRISPEDAGLWTDTQIPPLQRIVRFCHTQGSKVGVQLAHAGRKASTLAPWVDMNVPRTRIAGRSVALADENGWPDNVWGPTDIPYAEGYPVPKPLTEERMDYIEKAWIDATERCKKVGYDFIEVHAAHGYLLHEFLSPLSNTRTDKWGGQSLENRMRFPLRIISAIRNAWPDKPLFVRISGTDWAEGPEQVDGVWKQWGIEQSSIFTGELIKLGVDLLDVSSGALWHAQTFPPITEGYQAHLAARIKQDHPDLIVSAVGCITDPHYANKLIADGKVDAVRLARGLIRNADWPLWAASQLGVAVKTANQYERAWVPMLRRDS